MAEHEMVPYDTDAEALLLGGLFKQPALFRTLDLSPELFWTASLRRCFVAMQAMWQRNPRPFSYMDLLDELRRMHVRRAQDDATDIDLNGWASDVPARLAELQELAERRRRIDLAHRMVNEAYSPAPLRPWTPRVVPRQEPEDDVGVDIPEVA